MKYHHFSLITCVVLKKYRAFRLQCHMPQETFSAVFVARGRTVSQVFLLCQLMPLHRCLAKQYWCNDEHLHQVRDVFMALCAAFDSRLCAFMLTAHANERLPKHFHNKAILDTRFKCNCRLALNLGVYFYIRNIATIDLCLTKKCKNELQKSLDALQLNVHPL